MVHKSPSRIRYEAKHPQVSFRMAKHLKEVLDAAKGPAESYPVFLKRLLVESAEKLNESAIDNAHKKGYGEAKGLPLNNLTELISFL